jgi:uncharacterized Zn finger protein (UPF0148 family)
MCEPTTRTGAAIPAAEMSSTNPADTYCPTCNHKIKRVNEAKILEQAKKQREKAQLYYQANKQKILDKKRQERMDAKNRKAAA